MHLLPQMSLEDFFFCCGIAGLLEAESIISGFDYGATLTPEILFTIGGF